MWHVGSECKVCSLWLIDHRVGGSRVSRRVNNNRRFLLCDCTILSLLHWLSCYGLLSIGGTIPCGSVFLWSLDDEVPQFFFDLRPAAEYIEHGGCLFFYRGAGE